MGMVIEDGAGIVIGGVRNFEVKRKRNLDLSFASSSNATVFVLAVLHVPKVPSRLQPTFLNPTRLNSSVPSAE